MEYRVEAWGSNKVYYCYLDKGNKIIKNASQGSVCYSSLTSGIFNLNNKIQLFKFYKQENEIYVKDYLSKLSKIFNIKIKFLEEDKIEVTGFKSFFYFKLFLTFFRYLFENTVDNTLASRFLKYYIEDKSRKDLLYKLIKSIKETNFRLGNNNHCIVSTSPKDLKLKTIKELEEYNPRGYSPIHEFFIK